MSAVHSFDVVVVGGGPPGAAVARDIADAGFQVAIIFSRSQQPGCSTDD